MNGKGIGMRRGWLAGLQGLLLASCFACAANAEAQSIDVGALSCATYIDLEKADRATFLALVGWLDGWMQGEAVTVSYSVDAQAEQGARWLDRCRADPSIGLAAAAATATATAPAPDKTVSMAAFKCIEFLAVLEEDRDAATAMVRWIDGWHAAGANDPRFAASDHEQQVAAAAIACSHYPKRSLLKVMGGKYR